jgi:cell division GTPase FtsZ
LKRAKSAIQEIENYANSTITISNDVVAKKLSCSQDEAFAHVNKVASSNIENFIALMSGGISSSKVSMGELIKIFDESKRIRLFKSRINLKNYDLNMTKNELNDASILCDIKNSKSSIIRMYHGKDVTTALNKKIISEVRQLTKNETHTCNLVGSYLEGLDEKEIIVYGLISERDKGKYEDESHLDILISGNSIERTKNDQLRTAPRSGAILKKAKERKTSKPSITNTVKNVISGPINTFTPAKDINSTVSALSHNSTSLFLKNKN